MPVEKKSSKESKRGDKDDAEPRKRERGEKRRDRKVAPPSPTYPPNSPAYSPVSPRYNAPSPQAYSPVSHYESNDRFYGEGYDDARHRADRDLSSVSNSSKGSTNRRSQESPEHEREMKRRRIDGPKVRNVHAGGLGGAADFRF